jgi:hypothetical protein
MDNSFIFQHVSLSLALEIGEKVVLAVGSGLARCRWPAQPESRLAGGWWTGLEVAMVGTSEVVATGGVGSRLSTMLEASVKTLPRRSGVAAHHVHGCVRRVGGWLKVSNKGGSVINWHDY